MDNAELENRFAFHPAATRERRAAHSTVRYRCYHLAVFLNENLPDGREKSLAITHLEEVMFWGNAGLARQPETS